MDRRYDERTHQDVPTEVVPADTEQRTPATPVTTDRVSAERVVRRDPYDGIREAKDRFGGLDLPASLTGMLVSLAMLLILAGLASVAFGTIAFQTGTAGNQIELSVGALITAGVVLFVSFLIGGWAAGRMARYSGAVNGLMVSVWFLILLGVLAGLGAVAGDAYNLFDNLQVAKANLPDWFSADTVTTGAIVSAIAFAVVMFLGSILGGLWGQHFHRKADEIIVSRTDDDLRIVGDDVETRRV
jgi:MFS family permease